MRKTSLHPLCLRQSNFPFTPMHVMDRDGKVHIFHEPRSLTIIYWKYEPRSLTFVIFLFSKIWATITHVQFTITSRSYVYYIHSYFLVRKWTNETTFSNFLAYSNGWEANFKNEILQNNKILKYRNSFCMKR